jgi:hypothetical protein
MMTPSCFSRMAGSAARHEWNVKVHIERAVPRLGSNIENVSRSGTSGAVDQYVGGTQHSARLLDLAESRGRIAKVGGNEMTTPAAGFNGTSDVARGGIKLPV